METWESLSEAVALLDAPEPEQTESSLRDTGGTILYKLCLDSGVTPFRALDVDGIFVRFPIGEHFEIAGVTSSRFEAWMVAAFYETRKNPPRQVDIQDAVRLLSARAYETPKIPT